MAEGANVQPLSAVIWNNVATGTGVSGVSLRAWNRPFVSVFGNVSGACTIYLLYSQDGVTFYQGASTVLAGAGNFNFNVTTGAEFLALQSSANVTATAIISVKG